MIFSKKRSLILVFLMFWISGFGLKAQTSTVWDGTSNTDWYDEGADEFEIATAEQLAGLAELVNAGNDFSGKTVKLVADIVLNNTENWETWDETTEGLHAWIPIDGFSGCFDGQGHLVQGIYVCSSDYSSGFFAEVRPEASVKNLGVIKSRFILDRGTFAGIVVGYNRGLVSQCYTQDVIIDGGDWTHIGGIVGYHNGRVEQCFNTGTLKGTRFIGGIAGFAAGEIVDCFSTGLIYGSDSNQVGGIAGSSSIEATIRNCYYSGSAPAVADNEGAVFAVERKTSEDFADGTVCWLLNGRSSDNPKWFQTLGSDAVPVFDSKHGIVSASGVCPNSLTYNNNGFVEIGMHQDDDENCLCDFCQTIMLSKPVMLDNIYQISNVSELYWFAGLVNGTLVDGTEQDIFAQAVLTSDITINKNLLGNNGELPEETDRLLSWTPIGVNSNHIFAGSFDGQGHTISGVYINTNQSYQGLFGCLNGGNYFKAYIRNLQINDSYICGDRLIGGLVGSVGSENVVENIGVVRSKIVGNSDVGGIVGAVDAGVVRHCYNLSSVDGASKSGGIAGSNAGEISNCFYWNLCGALGDGIAKTSDEFSGGAVCWLLNGQSSDNPVWFQTLGSDEYPLMNQTHATVYASGVCPGKLTDYNNTANNIGEHEDGDEDYICDYCMSVILSEPVMLKDVYQISNVGELYWFAGLVNGTLKDGTEQNTKANAILTADIEINKNFLTENGEISNDIEIETLISWMPIGSYKNPFLGTFDGQNHEISGLYINDGNYQGLFGCLDYVYVGGLDIRTIGSVKNLTLCNSYIKGKDYIGGFVGFNGGLLRNLVVRDCVLEGNENVGGISGFNNNVLIGEGELLAMSDVKVSCYSIKGNKYVGGLVGSNNGSINNGLNNSNVFAGSGSGSDVEVNEWGGGIAGFSRGLIQNSSNKGNIVGLSKWMKIGGLVGSDEGESKIICCANFGEVHGEVGSEVGGIIGDASGLVENCFNVASVSCAGDPYEGSPCCGGISGILNGVVRNCYNIGTVSGNYVSVGGISGKSYDASFFNCYYLNTSASVGIGNEEGNELVTAKTMEDFASGHVARLLQGGQEDPSHPIWGQRLNGETKDLYPVLTADAKVCVYEADLYDGTNQVVSAYVNPDFLSESMTNEIAVLHDGYFIPVEDSRNVIVKDGAEYVCDNLELIDGADFYTPVPFLARKAVYRRVLPDESVWGTIAVPFAITNNDGATLYLPDEIIAEGTEESILAVKPLERMTLNPYEPALFQANVAGAELLFQATDAKIPATSDAVLTTTIGNGEYEIVGTMATIGQLEEGDLFIAQNKFWSVGTQKKVGLKAFRAYLTVPETSARVNALRIVVGDATSIRQEIMEKNNMPVDVYNASGMLLRRGVARSKALENLPAGLYIVSGKKIIKK